jgi:hypothetical protein
MALWGDKRYTELLEKENADLKDQNKKLTDAILMLLLRTRITNSFPRTSRVPWQTWC